MSTLRGYIDSMLLLGIVSTHEQGSTLGLPMRPVRTRMASARWNSRRSQGLSEVQESLLEHATPATIPSLYLPRRTRNEIFRDTRRHSRSERSRAGFYSVQTDRSGRKAVPEARETNPSWSERRGISKSSPSGPHGGCRRGGSSSPPATLCRAYRRACTTTLGVNSL